MPRTLPTPAFSTTALDTTVIPAGTPYGRIYAAAYPDPLGYGKIGSRYSDPRRRRPENRFGVLYLGSSLKVCFVETLVRDLRDGRTDDLPVAESELAGRHYADVVVETPLTLLDLRADGMIRMGIPSDVLHESRHSLSRKWSVAFQDHPAGVDGLIYPSRLNGEVNLAIYGRATGKLRSPAHRPLLSAPGLAGVLDTFKVALV